MGKNWKTTLFGHLDLVIGVLSAILLWFKILPFEQVVVIYVLLKQVGDAASKYFTKDADNYDNSIASEDEDKNPPGTVGGIG
tara:strand:- start:308 stop:553 length:246 start_codon:yes stop_codon:yes gene_type:complete